MSEAEAKGTKARREGPWLYEQLRTKVEEAIEEIEARGNAIAKDKDNNEGEGQGEGNQKEPIYHRKELNRIDEESKEVGKGWVNWNDLLDELKKLGGQADFNIGLAEIYSPDIQESSS